MVEGDPGFFFCIADSKDNSFHIGTPVDQIPYSEDALQNQEELMMMFAAQDKNKQS